MVERGVNIPKELTHYCTIHNKRDRKTIETKFNNTCNSMVVKKKLPRQFRKYVIDTKNPMIYFSKNGQIFNPVLYKIY